MSRAELVVERTMAVLAQSRALRERSEQQRRETFSRIQIASAKKPYALTKPGRQLSLQLEN